MLCSIVPAWLLWPCFIVGAGFFAFALYLVVMLLWVSATDKDWNFKAFK